MDERCNSLFNYCKNIENNTCIAMLDISNIALEIINIIGKYMKRIYLPLLIITYALVLAGIAIFHNGSTGTVENTTLEYIFVGMIFILFLAGFILFVKKYKMVKEGITTNDEMSKKIINRSAALSFYSSLVLWIVISFVQDSSQFSNGDMIGYGMIGMVTIFVLSLTYFNIKGVRE